MAGKHLQAGPLPPHHGDALADGQALGRIQLDRRPTLTLPAHPTQAFRIKGCNHFGLVSRGRRRNRPGALTGGAAPEGSVATA